MTDREFLIWIHERLTNVHGESHLVDYMHRFRDIIASIPFNKNSPRDGRGKNSIEELLKHLGVEDRKKELDAKLQLADLNGNTDEFERLLSEKELLGD